MKKVATTVIKIACHITLTLAIITSGLFFCINAQAITRILSDSTCTYNYTSYTKSQVVESAVLTRDFSVGRISKVELSEKLTNLGVDPLDLDQSMITHLEECTPIFKAITVAEIICSVIAIFFLVIIYKNFGTGTTAKIIRLDCTVASGIILVLLGLIVVDFDLIFENMHKLLFANGTWTFNYDSLLICMYPENFWIGVGATLSAISIIISVIGLIIARRLLKSVIK